MKLKKEFDKLPGDLQVHALMLISICKEISSLSKKKINEEIVTACAVLHDTKNNEEDHAKSGAEYAKKVLIKLRYSKKDRERIYDAILHHTNKSKTKDFSVACFYDADILCRFYPLGILRAWEHNKVHHPERDWRKLFKKVSIKKNLKGYEKHMKSKLQLKESKKLLDLKSSEHIASYGFLRELLR